MPQNFWKIDVNDPSQIDKIAFKEKKIVFLLLSKKIIQKRHNYALSFIDFYSNESTLLQTTMTKHPKVL
jgi:hypothetical protein